MENPRFTLSNGKELVVQIASFDMGYRLTKALNKILQKTGLNLNDELLNLDFSKFSMTPAVMMPLAEAFLSAMEDDSLQDLFWSCANSCTYDGLRINKQLFSDNIEMRGLFYPIKVIVLRENILPFFPQLRSWLNDTTQAEK